MQTAAQLSGMKHSLHNDITTSPAWQGEHIDRLLGFEILSRSLRAQYQPLDPARLADKVGLDKGSAFRIVQQIQRSQLKPF